VTEPVVEYAAGDRIAVRIGQDEDDVIYLDVVSGGVRIRSLHGSLAVIPEVTNVVRVIRVVNLNGAPWPIETQGRDLAPEAAVDDVAQLAFEAAFDDVAQVWRVTVFGFEPEPIYLPAIAQVGRGHWLRASVKAAALAAPSATADQRGMRWSTRQAAERATKAARRASRSTSQREG
jgi:hypothetical protein